MNAIMSLWTKPCLNGNHGYNSIQSMIESLVVSSNVAKKHFHNIYFYTDKIGYEWIRPYLDKLPFNKIEVCLDDLNWLDVRYWSIVKIYVYNLQKEPFIHLDYDVFLWDGIPLPLYKNDFFFQEIEYFNGHTKHYLKGIEIYKDAIPPNIEVKNAAFNCGIFGCVTSKGLGLIKDYYETSMLFTKNALAVDNKDYYILTQDRWLVSILIEQMTIYSLIIQGNYSYDTLLYDKFNIKYTHTMASSKKNPLLENKIRERIMLNDWNP